MFPPYVPGQANTSGDGDIPLVQGIAEPYSSSLPIPNAAAGNVVTATPINASAPPYNHNFVYRPPSQQHQGSASQPPYNPLSSSTPITITATENNIASFAYPSPLQQNQGSAHPPVQQTIDHAQGYAHTSQQQPLHYSQQQQYMHEQHQHEQQPQQPYIQQQYHQQQQSQMVATLADAKRLVVKQKFEPTEALAHATASAINMSALGNLGEIANRYDVFTDDGSYKFRVIEQSDYFGLTGRCCCNPNHQLKLHVYTPDAFSNTSEVMTFDRPCKCGQCCSLGDICRQEMIAYEGNGQNQIGYIKQPFLGGGLSPALQVMEREGDEPYATIQADAVCCIAGLCCDHTFVVKDAYGNKIGTIVKLKPDSLGQFSQELVSDADVFSIEFQNKDLDVNKKATLFGALHLIDYMFFENEGHGTVDLANRRGGFKLCDLYCFGCVLPCRCTCGHGDGG